MKLRKIFALSLLLFSNLSIASDELDKESTSITPVLITVKEKVVIEEQPEEQELPLSPRSASKKAFKDYQNTSPNSNIIINLKEMSYEQFISLKRLFHGLGISHETPKLLVDAYTHVKPLYQPFQDGLREEFNILSLGGGGTRGYIQAIVLKYIEKISGKRISDLFDLVIGTSTGSFTVAGACFDRYQPKIMTNIESDPSIPSGPYTAKEIAKLYTEESKIIFGSYYYTSMRGARGTQYDSGPLEKVVLKYFGDRLLAEAKIPVIFTIQDLNTASPFFYCSETLKQNLSYELQENKPLRDIVREATSAPNYFDPVQTQNGKTSSDCGITNNSPVIFALTEGSRLFNVGFKKLNVFSLETGFVKPDPNMSYKNLGALSWFEIISTNIFNGESQHFTAERLIKAYEKQDLLHGKGEYLRLQFNLPLDLSYLDKYDPKFFEGLKKIAKAYINQNKQQLDAYINKLMRAKGFGFGK